MTWLRSAKIVDSQRARSSQIGRAPRERRDGPPQSAHPTLPKARHFRQVKRQLPLSGIHLSQGQPLRLLLTDQAACHIDSAIGANDAGNPDTIFVFTRSPVVPLRARPTHCRSRHRHATARAIDRVESDRAAHRLARNVWNYVACNNIDIENQPCASHRIGVIRTASGFFGL